MKLDQEDATQICKRVVDHDVDTKIVAAQFEISRRRVQQLANTHQDERPCLDHETYDKHRLRFGTLDEFLTFYNQERPHMSLNWDELETPADAFDRLLPSPTDDLNDPLATEVSTDE